MRGGADGLKPAKKTAYVESYGCQMNEYDAQRIKEELSAQGWRLTDNAHEAGFAVVNGCHIRDKAGEKAHARLGRLRGIQKRRALLGERMGLALTGCVAQAEGGEALKRSPGVHAVLGPQSLHKVGEAAEASWGRGEKTEALDFDVLGKFRRRRDTKVRGVVEGASAFLTVQEGCDKFCSFCVVPYTRGAEASRSVSAVLEEARALASAGAKELTVLGQNVNAYRGEPPRGKGEERWGLGRLLRALARVEGVERLRYTTSHPRDMDEELLSAHEEEEKVAPWLHLPAQSGSDEILASMNRRYTRREYVELMEKVRERCGDMAISGDFIVGYPGESEGDFQETLSLAREIGYAQGFSFVYSARPGTPAARRVAAGEGVDKSEALERLGRLQEVLGESRRKFNEGFEGRVVEVLATNVSSDGRVSGRTRWMQLTRFSGSAVKVGDMVEVEVTRGGPHALEARVAEEARVAGSVS